MCVGGSKHKHQAGACGLPIYSPRLADNLPRPSRPYLSNSAACCHFSPGSAAQCYSRFEYHFKFQLVYFSVIMRPSSLGGGRILRRTLSVCLSVRPVIVAIGNVFSSTASVTDFSARTEGRISYGHLGRTNSCWLCFFMGRCHTGV